jgi:putative transposase
LVVEGISIMTTPYRRGRSVVCSLHVHLVFISKYKRGVLSGPAHRLLRDSLEQVCDDFGAGLLESDGEDDHVRLRVEYPATIQRPSSFRTLSTP